MKYNTKKSFSVFQNITETLQPDKGNYFIFFVKNAGQLTGMSGMPAENVGFYNRFDNYTDYFLDDWFSYVTRKKDMGATERIDVRFYDFNYIISPEGDKELSCFSNFFTVYFDRDNDIQASHYETLFCCNIDEGVDLKFYLYKGVLHYDFLVNNPEADSTNNGSGYNSRNANDQAAGVLSDESGNIVILRLIDNIGFPTTTNAYDDSHNNNEDTVNVKLNSDATVTQWETYFGGNQSDFVGGLDTVSLDIDYGKGIDTDPDNNMYITGTTQSTDFPNLNAELPSRSNYSDLFISKFTPSSGIEWSTYFGGDSNDIGIDVEYSDVYGQIYFTSDIQNDDLTLNNGKLSEPFQDAYGGSSYDTFLGSFDTNGNYTLDSYYGGEDVDYPRDIEFVDNKNVIVGKTLGDETFHHCGDSYQKVREKNFDAYYATVNGFTGNLKIDGDPRWSSLSSPVVNYPYDDMLGPIWKQGFSGPIPPPSGTPSEDLNVYFWGVDSQDWVVAGGQDDIINEAGGFIISVFLDDKFDGPGYDTFPKNFPIASTGYLTGDITLTTFTNSTTATMADGEGEYTFLGNPYEVHLDYDELITKDITDVAYLFNRNAGGRDENGNNGDWISWNGTSGSLSEGLISQMQDFFVQNDASFTTGPSVEFTSDSYRSVAPFYGKEQSENIQNIRFELRGENTYSSMWLNFMNNGSFEAVHGDAVKLQPFSHDYAMLATQKENGDLLDIGRFRSPLYSNENEEDFAIPVYATTTQPGSYTLTVIRQDLPPGEELYIRDLETGEEFVLDEDFENEFTIVSATAAKDPSTEGLEPCSIYPEPKKAKSTGEPRFMGTKTKSMNLGPDSLPSEFKLNQKYPNPFKPTTQITYQLLRQANVRLEVFDMNGREVATLVNERVSAGTQTVNFDASNLTIGVYLYKLQAGSAVITKKLTLFK